MLKKIIVIIIMMLLIGISIFPIVETEINHMEKISTFLEINNESEDLISSNLILGNKPTITDNSGKTTFYGLFIGQNKGRLKGEDDANAMDDTLDENKGDQFKGWKPENKQILDSDNSDCISCAINKFKDGNPNPPDPKPGDEFIFYYSGHGSDKSRPDGKTNKTLEPEEGKPDTKDEPNGFDNSIEVKGGTISDDELAEWLSGFPKCVTITVILDCCYSGTFTDGEKDLKSATNSEGEPYGDHLSVIPASKTTTKQRPYVWDDKNGDWDVSPDELTGPLKWTYDDEDGDKKRDPGEKRWLWNDKDGDNKIDDGEKIDPDDDSVKMISDLTIGILNGLQKPKFFDNNVDTTIADRNKDGETTSKELFEYAIYNLNEDLIKDNDNDGLLNEDDYDHEDDPLLDENFLDIDNDGDLLIDEDPAPHETYFWPNEMPDKPNPPSGKTSGEAGIEYTYYITGFDPDGDDLYYKFDWGDGEISEWSGLYPSNEEYSLANIWDEQGSYDIKVKIRDACLVESEWSDPLSISMPLIKQYSSFLEKFFQYFPFIKIPWML